MEPRTHYQISLTARQAVGIFVGLLLALGLAFFFGLMAMRVLRARLYQRALDERRAEEERRVGEKKSIEWGSQIRSYVLHPYQMVKDHRTGHETGDTDSVLDGEITPFIEAYLRSRADASRAVGA